MNIKELLHGYRILIEGKLDKELEEQIELIKKDDISVKKINDIKNLMINELKSINETVRKNNGEQDLYSEEDLEYIIRINNSKVKLTSNSLKEIELIKASNIDRKDKLIKKLNEVYLLATYLNSSEEVSKLLNDYKITNEDGHFNIDIV